MHSRTEAAAGLEELEQIAQGDAAVQNVLHHDHVAAPSMCSLRSLMILTCPELAVPAP